MAKNKKKTVSVQLSEEEYQELMYVKDRYNSNLFAKVTIADILRLGLKQMYYKEKEEENAPTSIVEKSKEIEQEYSQHDTENK
ncbi:hypothetical protein CHCC14819_0489 [Bacillus licheniformis]|uniref:hypothetical protein n=1 Tax=Bacillus licheniformis TaxID=1402 RepID=UPI0011A5790B|nr:hypothetical protein [Bacillus licheniformis]TWM32293.1 hypothetical protein CHCC14819_0489 [Bacillus licheniformis]